MFCVRVAWKLWMSSTVRGARGLRFSRSATSSMRASEFRTSRSSRLDASSSESGGEDSISATSSSENSVPSRPVVPRTARMMLRLIQPLLDVGRDRYAANYGCKRFHSRGKTKHLGVLGTDPYIEMHIPAWHVPPRHKRPCGGHHSGHCPYYRHYVRGLLQALLYHFAVDIGMDIVHCYHPGGMMISHLGPLARPSLSSRVARGRSSASANATYQAS